MKSVKRLLQDTGEELTAGKKLLVEKKRLAKRAKGKIARSNAKRQVQVIDEAVDFDHRPPQAAGRTTARREDREGRQGREERTESEERKEREAAAVNPDGTTAMRVVRMVDLE